MIDTSKHITPQQFIDRQYPQNDECGIYLPAQRYRGEPHIQVLLVKPSGKSYQATCFDFLLMRPIFFTLDARQPLVVLL